MGNCEICKKSYNVLDLENIHIKISGDWNFLVFQKDNVCPNCRGELITVIDCEIEKLEAGN